MFFYILPTCNNLLYRRAFGIQIHIYLFNIAECSDIADVARRLSSRYKKELMFENGEICK